MAKDEVRTFNATDIVPVQALIPETQEGEGALAVMRDATFRLLIRTGAVNFDMKSPAERAGVVAAFGDLLDSLSPETPIQIVQHSKSLDSTAYSRQFTNYIQGNRLPARLRQLAIGHVEHFQEMAKSQNLLSRELYVVLTSKGASAPVTDSMRDQMPLGHIFRSLGRAASDQANWRQPTAQEIQAARHDLSLRGDEMEARLTQIGVWTHRLDEAALRNLLNELFNPRRAERQSVSAEYLPRFQGAPATRHTPRGELEPPRFS